MSFVALLLYITVIYIRPQEWVPAVYAWPLVSIMAVITTICVFIDAGLKQKLRINEPQILLLFGFLGAVIMSHISHGYFGGAWDSFLKFGSSVVIFFLFVNALNTEKKIKIAVWVIIILTVILAIQGIYQYNNGIGWAGQPIITDKQGESVVQRITWIGIFNDPNDLALAFVVAIGLLISFIFNKSSWFLKVGSFPLAGVLIYSLYLTNSRGGYLAFAATVGYFFLRKFKNKFIAVAIGGILAFSVLLVGPSRMADVSADDDSAQGRIEAWYEGFQMLKGAPIFGVGYEMFADNYHITAHNSYILVAAEEGLVGLFCWTGLIYMCFKGLYTLSSPTVCRRLSIYDKLPPTKECLIPAPSPYILGLESGLIGHLAASYFLSRSYVAPLYILLALAASFAYCGLKKEEYAFNIDAIKKSVLITVGVLVLVWISTRVSLKLVG